MKRLLFILCVLLSTQIVAAQIISQKIKTVKYVEKPKKEYPYAYKSGYRGFVEGALSLNFDGYYMTGFDVLTTHGYQCGSLFYIGAGVGILGTEECISKGIETHYLDYGFNVNLQYQDESTILFSVPIYADARLYMSKTKVKPFVDIKLGYMLPLNSKKHILEIICDIPSTDRYSDHWSYSHDNDWYGHSHYTTIRYNGLYSQIGLGIESKHMTFGVHYSMRGYKEEDYYYDVNDNASFYDRRTRLNAWTMTVNVGVHF